MNTKPVRLVAVVGLLTSLSWAIPATSGTAAATTPSTTVEQKVTGGGIGYHSDPSGPVVTHTGNYSSVGQLGSGHFTFDDGDTDGTARVTRSDAMVLKGTTRKTPGACGAIPTSTYCLVVSLHGTRDIASADLRLAVLVDFGHSGRTSFLMNGALRLTNRIGYAMVDATGTTYTFGGIEHYGDAHTIHARDIESTPTANGYWIVNDAGEVFAFGDARYLGNATRATFFPGELVTSMSSTPTGNGYWLFTSKGRAITFGDARNFGDLRGTALNGGIVGSIATPTGKGYYMAGADGGVFAFGDAKFYGSTGNLRLNQPVVGLVPTPTDTGYWLVASDGGVFSFNAPFRGSLGAIRLNQPVNTMVRYGDAYLMVAADGGIFNFSHNPFFGSLGGTLLPAPITNAAAAG